MTNLKLFLTLMLLSTLAGCGDSGVSEVKEWMAKVKKETPVKVSAISEPKVFIPVGYSGDGLIDPFDPGKLLVIFARMQAANDNGLKPDFDRPKEALEGYPLETMKMSGTFDNNKSLQALISVGKALFTVNVGAYVGQNFGKIINITETRIDLIERVQDASGEWAERKSSLELQEAK